MEMVGNFLSFFENTITVNFPTIKENYLSEHHYEEPLDEDSARRLLSFGDDYRNYLDSLSEGPPSLQENNHDDQQQQQQRVNGEQERGSEGRRQRRTRRHHHHHHHKGAEHVAGDEDDDDASDEEAKAARTVAKYDLKRKQIENEVKTLLQKWKGKETVHRLVRFDAVFIRTGLLRYASFFFFFRESSTP